MSVFAKLSLQCPSMSLFGEVWSSLGEDLCNRLGRAEGFHTEDQTQMVLT